MEDACVHIWNEALSTSLMAVGRKNSSTSLTECSTLIGFERSLCTNGSTSFAVPSKRTCFFLKMTAREGTSKILYLVVMAWLGFKGIGHNYASYIYLSGDAYILLYSTI